MDIAKLKAGLLPVWVPFIKGRRLQVRHIPRTELAELAELATAVEMVDGKPVEKFDNNKFNNLICQRAVVGWEGFTENGQPAAITPENIQAVADVSGLFVTTVRSACTDLERFIEDVRGAERKNSRSTSRPGSTSPESPARRAAKQKK
jgi:hypothetical protein